MDEMQYCQQPSHNTPAQPDFVCNTNSVKHSTGITAVANQQHNAISLEGTLTLLHLDRFALVAMHEFLHN